MAFGGIRPKNTDLFIIASGWSVLIATMLALQTLGFDFGFNIWPIGEFRNWLEFLQDGPGTAQPRSFGHLITAMPCLLGGTSRRAHSSTTSLLRR